MFRKSLEIYESFLAERRAKTDLGPIAPYDWVDLPSSLPISWMAYSQFLQEHSRELSNSINEFRRLLADVSSWRHVVEKLEGEDFHEALIEFVSPRTTLTLLMPKTIQSRFVYSVAHLSNQANSVLIEDWKDDLPIDKDIQFNQADQYGGRWKAYKKLKKALEKISGKDYATATHDFRNSFAHRYSPRIELGLTGLVTRLVAKDGEVSYGFGETEPLKLAEVVPLLRDQHEKCIEAYGYYQELVNEQCWAIRKHITERCS